MAARFRWHNTRVKKSEDTDVALTLLKQATKREQEIKTVRDIGLLFSLDWEQKMKKAGEKWNFPRDFPHSLIEDAKPLLEKNTTYVQIEPRENSRWTKEVERIKKMFQKLPRSSRKFPISKNSYNKMNQWERHDNKDSIKKIDYDQALQDLREHLLNKYGDVILKVFSISDFSREKILTKWSEDRRKTLLKNHLLYVDELLELYKLADSVINKEIKPHMHQTNIVKAKKIKTLRRLYEAKAKYMQQYEQGDSSKWFDISRLEDMIQERTDLFHEYTRERKTWLQSAMRNLFSQVWFSTRERPYHVIAPYTASKLFETINPLYFKEKELEADFNQLTGLSKQSSLLKTDVTGMRAEVFWDICFKMMQQKGDKIRYIWELPMVYGLHDEMDVVNSIDAIYDVVYKNGRRVICCVDFKNKDVAGHIWFWDNMIVNMWQFLGEKLSRDDFLSDEEYDFYLDRRAQAIRMRSGARRLLQIPYNIPVVTLAIKTDLQFYDRDFSLEEMWTTSQKMYEEFMGLYQKRLEKNETIIEPSTNAQGQEPTDVDDSSKEYLTDVVHHTNNTLYGLLDGWLRNYTPKNNSDGLWVIDSSEETAIQGE